MGILLPPVPQATVTTLTLHHRNRSLDSALQRIPEVDVTPSPECETIPDIQKPSSSSTQSIKLHSRERDDLASLGSDDSGILCGSDSGSSDVVQNITTHESSTDHSHSRESLDSSLSHSGDIDSGGDTIDGHDSSVSLSPINNNELINNKIDCNLIMTSKNNDLLLNGDCRVNNVDENNEDIEEIEINNKNIITNGDNTAKERCNHDMSVNTVYKSTMEIIAQRELTGAAITLCCGVAKQNDDETICKSHDNHGDDDNNLLNCRQETTTQPKPSEGCLLRLFESQIFDMSMAISYLFNSKEPGVQSYLGEYFFFLLLLHLNTLFVFVNFSFFGFLNWYFFLFWN